MKVGLHGKYTNFLSMFSYWYHLAREVLGGRCIAPVRVDEVLRYFRCARGQPLTCAGALADCSIGMPSGNYSYCTTFFKGAVLRITTRVFVMRQHMARALANAE